MLVPGVLPADPRAVGPTRANLTAYVVPLVAAVAGVVVPGETVAANTAAGFVVIAVGFLVTEWDAFRASVGHRRDGTAPPPGGGAPADATDEPEP